jgi:hypothetical protein
MPMLAQIDELAESADVDATLGLDGRTLQDSTGAGSDTGVGPCVHMLWAAGELGSRGGWRTTSMILGGGGRRGLNKAMTLDFTSSLFPLSSSPAPSSSRPSRAETWVRKTNLLMAWTNYSCSFLHCCSFSDQSYVLALALTQWMSLWYSISDSIVSGVSL